MSRVAPMVPAESDLLCEGCGYTLNGLPQSSNCPECGKPIEQSLGTHRALPEWESSPGKIVALLTTTKRVIFQPTRFFQKAQTRFDGHGQLIFALIYWTISAVLFAVTAMIHLGLVTGTPVRKPQVFIPILATLVVLILGLLTLIAAKLSAWEARYRGLRLPLSVVQRGLYYHAAHYLPVALLSLGIVLAYRVLLQYRVVTHLSDTVYLYVLCGAIVISAMYLFWTYWIAMRNMMYANR